jgi:beta-galactosidase GanA
MQNYKIIFKGISFIFFQIILSLCFSNAYSQQKTPFIQKKGTTSELIIGGNPFLIRGGELANSSASSLEYMQSLWPTLDQMNLNTILAPVYWELMEPVEGKFDFSLVDGLIYQARQHQVKLIFLWFGSWKNSMSCYAPAWVKRDTARFPRALDKTGHKVEILSPFSNESLEADKKAFCELLSHIKKVDAALQTVIMVQVENETAMLPNARDYSNEANKQYVGKVPGQLMNYLTENEKSLQPELSKIWTENGKKSKGTWPEVFGNSIYGEEIFQAWYYAFFTEELT